MKKTFYAVVTKSLIIFGIFAAIYGSWLGLKVEYRKELENIGTELSELRWNLVQNRLAFVGLTKLDPSSASAIGEKEGLLTNVEESIRTGLEKTDSIKIKWWAEMVVIRKWPELIRIQREVYARQREILDNLYKQQTFADGMKVLKSEQSVKLLTDQTNLILEYEFWGDKIREKLYPTR